jgi:hypothetical protein
VGAGGDVAVASGAVVGVSEGAQAASMADAPAPPATFRKFLLVMPFFFFSAISSFLF